jgi:hypothetical protein
MTKYTRRNLLGRAIGTAVAVTAGISSARAMAVTDSCVAADSESLRNSLHYVSRATDAKKACLDCAFFTGNTGKPACGNCMIFSGTVDATGNCESWSPKG